MPYNIQVDVQVGGGTILKQTADQILDIGTASQLASGELKTLTTELGNVTTAAGKFAKAVAQIATNAGNVQTSVGTLQSSASTVNGVVQSLDTTVKGYTANLNAAVQAVQALATAQATLRNNIPGGTGGGNNGGGGGNNGGIGALLQGGFVGALGVGSAAGVGFSLGKQIGSEVREAIIGTLESWATDSRATKVFADRIGVSIRDARNIQNLGQVGGVNGESVAAGARYIVNALEDEEGAGRKVAQALERLKVSTKDLNGETREEGAVILDVLHKLADIPDKTERAREGYAALGRGYKEIAPLVDELNDLQKVLDQWGVKVDTEVLQKGDAAFQQWQAFLIVMKQLRDELAGTFGPAFISGLKFTTDSVRTIVSISGAFKETFDQIGRIQTGAVLGFGENGLFPLPKPKIADNPPSNFAQEANKRNAESFRDNLEDGDDKYGLSRARKELTSAQKRLDGVLVNPSASPKDEKSAEDDIRDANNRVKAIEARIKATKELETVERSLEAFEKRAHEKESTPVERAYIDRDELVKKGANSGRATDAADILAKKALEDEQNKQAKLPLLLNGSGLDQSFAGLPGLKPYFDKLPKIERDGPFADDIKGGQKELDRRSRDENSDLKKHNEDLKRDDSARIAEIKAAADDAVRLIQQTASLKDHPDLLPDQRKEAESADQLKASKDVLATRQQELQDIQAVIKAHDYLYDQEKELADFRKEANRDEERHQEQLIALRQKYLDDQRKQIDETRNLFSNTLVNVFNASTSHNAPTQLRGLVQGIARSSADHLVGNFGNIIASSKTFTNLIPHASDSDSFIGKLLSGTPFGAKPKDPTVTDNTSATRDNTEAVKNNTAALSGKAADGSPLSAASSAVSAVSPSSGGILSSVGKIFTGGGIKNPFVFNALPGAASSDPGSGEAPEYNGAPPGTTEGGFLSSAGGKVGFGATAALGGLAAFGQFSKGGVGGIAGGLGSLAGTAGALVGLAGVTGPLAPILAGAGAALGIISGLFSQGPAQREKQINKELAQSQYNAPQSLNYSSDTSGHYASIGIKGELRQSDFSAIPQVDNPYTFWKSGTPYQVPGQVVTPYGPPTQTVAPAPQAPAPPQNVYHGPVYNGDIHAMDTQSFHDYLQRNSEAVGNAAAKNLQSGDGRLVSAVSQLTR